MWGIEGSREGQGSSLKVIVEVHVRARQFGPEWC